MLSFEADETSEDVRSEILKSWSIIPAHWKALITKPILVYCFAFTRGQQFHPEQLPNPEQWKRKVEEISHDFYINLFGFSKTERVCAFPGKLYYSEADRTLYAPIHYRECDNDDENQIDLRCIWREVLGDAFQSAIAKIVVRDDGEKFHTLCRQALREYYHFEEGAHLLGQEPEPIPSAFVIESAVAEAVPHIWRKEHLGQNGIIIIGKHGTSEDWRRTIPGVLRLERVLENRYLRTLQPGYRS